MKLWKLIKFNPYHDASNGEFSSSGEGGEGNNPHFDLSPERATDTAESSKGYFGDRESDQEFEYSSKIADSITDPTSVSDSDYKAMNDYTNHGYGDDVNSELRSGNTLSDNSMSHNKTVADGLDSIISKNALPENMALYKGVSNWKQTFGVDSDKSLVGTVFQDKGFVSTSIEKPKAFDYSGADGDPYRTIIEINAPKGMHAAAMTPNFTTDGEVVLPRNTSFEITGVKYEKGTNSEGNITDDVRRVIVKPVMAKSASGNPTVSKGSRFTWKPGDIQRVNKVGKSTLWQLNKDQDPMAGTPEDENDPAIIGPVDNWRKQPQQIQTNKKRRVIPVTKDSADVESSGDDTTTGPPSWQSSGDIGRTEPQYQSQKPDGNKDTLFSENVNENAPNAPAPDENENGYLMW